MKNNIFTIVIMILTLSCTHTNSFIFNPSPKIEKPNRYGILVVLPLKDSRETEYIDYRLLSFIPLVPYGTKYSNQFEKDGGSFNFRPKFDLTYAIVEEIEANSLFKETYIPYRISKAEGDYFLSIDLKKTKTKLTMTTYMIGILGIYLWILGLPMQYEEITVSLHFEIRNKQGVLIFQKTYEKNDNNYGGYYYLTGLNEMINKSFENIIKEFVSDIRTLKLEK
ncbi:hypothetical protein [Leptospira vanthielii]|uniref:Lipoprotein n=1 Tax=Leptospira vanthielii TaxID=293085 RepID=A0ABY2NN97_9LEPT|nr:hypothetical protein [Leptospira vanthielii]TGM53744.1 hypothetical protein EHQ95_10590 [Leptospira vanthielii]